MTTPKKYTPQDVNALSVFVNAMANFENDMQHPDFIRELEWACELAVKALNEHAYGESRDLYPESVLVEESCGKK